MIAAADFASAVAALASPRMGTESMAPLLYSLVRLLRPATLLEVGVGYTTPFLLKALADNAADIAREQQLWPDKNRLLDDQAAAPLLHGSLSRFAALDKTRKLRWLTMPPSLADPDFYTRPYTPRLVAIDDLSSPNTSARRIEAHLGTLPGHEHLVLVDGSFRGRAATLAAMVGTFDFIWFDCGGHREYRDFLDEYWPLLDGNGGTLLLHYTLTNLSMGSVIKDLKIRQATTGFEDFELLSLREPHKMMQNSVSLIRKTTHFRDRIYYEVRDISLESD